MELRELLREHETQFAESWLDASQPTFDSFDDGSSQLYRHDDSGSGGYFEYVFKYAAETLFDRQIDSMQVTVGRSVSITDR